MVPAPSIAAIVLQAGPGGPEMPVPGVDPVVGLVGSAVGSFLTTLIVGALLVVLAPDYTARMTDSVRDEPVESFLYGFLAIVVVIVVVVVLAITIVGIIVAIPLAIAAALATAVGAAVTYLAIGETLLDRGRDDGWGEPLLVGAAIAGGLALIPLGGLVAFAISTAGFGAMLREYVGDDGGDGRSGLEDDRDRSTGAATPDDPAAEDAFR